MITSKQELKKYLFEDAKANRIQPGLAYLIKLLYGNINACVYRYLKSLRKLEYYTNIKSPLRYWYRYYNRRMGLKYNLAMPINAVGYGLYIPHIEGGVILNVKKVGCYCKINSGVVCGSKNTGEEIPTIGDYVNLTVGAKVIGNITIGNYSIVAPNSVVIKDVSDYDIVSGVPAKVIKTNAPKR